MKLVERSHSVLSPVLGHFTEIEIARGKGCYLYDFNNQQYLDFTSGIAVASTGHCHPKVVQAIKTQVDTLIHACAGVVYYAPNIQLAERLGQIIGHGLSSVFFTQSGSEANEAALKLALYTSKKKRILAFQGGFHGRTMGALSMTSSSAKYHKQYESFLGPVDILPYPYEFRCPWGKSGPQCGEHGAKEVERYLREHHQELAAVIIEPMLGEGGYVPAPPQFLEALSQLCKDYGVLLISDEIQTGIGRTGQWLMGHHYNFKPDIVTVAKGLGSGMPIGACMASPDLMAQWTTGSHGGTYGGNPVTCAAALATIEVISDCLPNIQSLGEVLKSQLQDALSDHPYVGEIRGMGLMVGIELVKDQRTKEPFPELVTQIRLACLDQQLLVVSCGPFGNVLRLMPPLIIDEQRLKAGANIVIEALNVHR